LADTSPVSGAFYLSCAALFALLMTGGIVGGKAAAGVVINERLEAQLRELQLRGRRTRAALRPPLRQVTNFLFLGIGAVRLGRPAASGKEA
jgi:hypothetical protein